MNTPTPRTDNETHQLMERELAAARLLLEHCADMVTNPRMMLWWYVESGKMYADFDALAKAIRAFLAESRDVSPDKVSRDAARMNWLEDEKNREALAFTIRQGQSCRSAIDEAMKPKPALP